MTDFTKYSSNNETNNKEKLKINDIQMKNENNDLIKDKQKNNDNERMNNIEDNSNENNNYKQNSFNSLSVNTSKNLNLGQGDKIMLEYKKNKNNFNKVVSTFNNTTSKPFKNKDKYIKKLSEYNMTLLNYLSQLSTLLNKILDNPKLYTNKNLLNSVDISPKPRIIFTQNNQILDNSKKILSIYEKQYNKITERLKIIKSDEYINELKSNITNLNKEIIVYEKENIGLKKGQLIFENSLKNKYNGKTSLNVESNYQKKLDTYKKVQNEYIITSKKIENNKTEIQNNSKKINTLNLKCEKLKKMAKDMYSIEQFEAVESIRKRSKEKKDKIQRKIREYEINIHSIKSGLNKLKMDYEQNKKYIEFMEQEKKILIEKYNNKRKELELVNNKIKGYKSNNNKNNVAINSRNINNNIKEKNMNIKTEDSIKEENKNNNNINDNRINKVLMSGGPSLISLTKEKSNFGDINDIQLINSVENQKENDNQEEEKEKENDNQQINQIDKDININIIGGNNKNKIGENEKDKINKNKNNKTLSKEMILKGLDIQEKQDNNLIYSSRIIPSNNNNNKGNIDRRNFLKLNFSFVTPSKDNRLNRSLNTLPNERNMLNYEIEEDIVFDSNSANNINNNTKEKKFNTNIEDVHISQDQNDNNMKNNNSIEIDNNLEINELINNEKDENNDDKDKREKALNTILYNEVDNKTKNEKFLESNKNNNENNNNEEEQINKSLEEEHVFDKKNENGEEKISENKEEGKENENKREDKEEEKEDENKNNNGKEETDSVNYDFDEGDNIIEADYEKDFI